MVDNEETKEQGTKTPAENQGDGVKSKTVEQTERINAETERLNQAIAENENAKARAQSAGILDAGQPPKEKKEMTDQEYAQAVMRGDFDGPRKEQD